MKSIICLAALLFSLIGCAPLNTPALVETPKLPRPEPPHRVGKPQPMSGAIFAYGNHRPLFENRRAMQLGDVLLVKIVEKTSASKKSNSKIDRQASANGSLISLPFAQTSTLDRLSIEGRSNNQFEGKGETGSDNDFSGQISVTVDQVMANGNLVVTGEKQVGINGNVDRIKFYGIVDPTTILPDNSVLSTRVADARIEFSGSGTIRESQVMGWLSRFFLTFLPI